MKNIFIAAHYNLNNGDRAVLEATIRLLKKNIQDCSITVSTFAPLKLNDSRFKVVGWPIKQNRFIRKIYLLICKYFGIKSVLRLKKIICDTSYCRELKLADIVLISGGHHLTDILGIETFYNLASNFIVPIALKKKIILLPQTIGPINNMGLQKEVQYLLNNISFIAYRDISSKLNLDKLNIETTYQYVPDLVFSLSPDFSNLIKKNSSIGIALYCNYNDEKREQLFPIVINNLSKEILRLLRKGHYINFIPMETKGSASDDRIVASKIIQSIPSDLKNNINILESQNDDIMETLNNFAMNDLIIAYKTHSVVFSCICSVPLVAVTYHQKSREFLETMGLDDYCIEDKYATNEKLQYLVESALSNSQMIIKKQSVGVSKNIKLINSFVQQIIRFD